MDETTIRHLQLIQSVIDRMCRNSFAYKGWAITLVSAIFALAAKETSPEFLLIALLPALAFWGLDAYYLTQERLFRALYDAVRDERVAVAPFSMDTSTFKDGVQSWSKAIFSKSVLGLYLPLTAVVVVATVVAYVLNK